MYIKTSIGVKAIIGVSSCWCLLGFRRGTNSYNYRYSEYNKYADKKEPYMYSTSIANGVLGVLIYANPLLFGLIIPKEIYRLEVNIRGMEDEKKKAYYNELF